MSKLETKCRTRVVSYYSVAVVIALLLLTETRGQDYDPDETNQYLLNLYEGALVNDNLSLFKLRQLYFNPSLYMYSSSFCLHVKVMVKDISNLYPPYCNTAAFGHDRYESYFFTSYCLLQPVHDSSDASKLSNLLSFSASADMFYIFDPTFYSLMQALAKSIETTDFGDTESEYYIDYPSQININIDGELDYNPCWDNAVYALRMLLVWVSTLHL